MAINYPTSLDSLSNPAAGDALNSPSHSAQHIAENDIVEALEAKVGINSSAVTNSLDYLMKALPEGFLINGKIVPSVATSHLTVAIKGMDGNDPSATNPVYCRINSVVRSITAALSVTLVDATNWCNAGSAEFATKEIDYFVYLGYNATDGVVVGFSRIPYACIYSDFSATTTNEKYCRISTITNAAAGDSYVNIGRFAATLSATAAFTWTVPTFTNKNLIQRPIYETRTLSWEPTRTLGSTYVATTNTATYKIIDNMLFFLWDGGGNLSGSTGYIRISLPMSGVDADTTPTQTIYDGAARATPLIVLRKTAGVFDIYKTLAAANWVSNETGTDIDINGYYQI
jgi:hypothetical protein